MKHQDKTERIIQAFYKVYNNLGYGFLEKVYQKALVLELTKMGFDCKAEYPVKVFYEGILVGDYRADVIVDDSVIVENKAAVALAEENEFQLINYLKATEIEVGLLLNFGKTPQFKRKIFSNEIKHNLRKQSNDTKDFS